MRPPGSAVRAWRTRSMITFDLSDDGNGATPRATSKRAARTISQIPPLGPFLKRARKAVPVFGEVSVLLTLDGRIRQLNRRFRGKNKSTDVLSFPAMAIPESERPRGNRLRPPTFAGDLAVSIETASRQAEQFGHSLQVELKILLLHGLLHLAGYDHETDAGEMAHREDQLRRRFRLPSALIARSSDGPLPRKPRSKGRR